MGTIAYRPTKEHEERFDVLAKRTGRPKSFYLNESSGGGFTVRGGGLIVVPMGYGASCSGIHGPGATATARRCWGRC